jgi:hypothetical protein
MSQSHLDGAGAPYTSIADLAGQASEVAALDLAGALALAVSIMLLTFAVERLWTAVRALALATVALGGLAVAAAVLVVGLAAR